MNRTSQVILKTHAVFLMVLTVMLTIGGFVGMNTGMGPFSWLRDVPIALVGLMQAYLLMFVVGVSLWMGAGGKAIWRWSVVAIVAHCIPLLAIFSLWNVLVAGGYLGIANYSYVIHGVWITVEVISLAIFARQQNMTNVVATSPQL